MQRKLLSQVCLATDIKIGEDDQTKIDFETADEIHFYAANAHQIKLVDGALVPATDNDVDLGTSSAEFKDAYFDGTVTADAFAGPINGDLTGTLQTAAQANVTSLGTLTTLTVDNIIINGTNIGHTSDTDSIAIASDGVVTFSQAPVFPDGSINIADIDLDGGTDIGAASVDADLFVDRRWCWWHYEKDCCFQTENIYSVHLLLQLLLMILLLVMQQLP